MKDIAKGIGHDVREQLVLEDLEQRSRMAPVLMWHPDAQPFAKLYKEDRILSEEYLTHLGGDRELVGAFVEWGMAFSDIRPYRRTN